MDPLTIALIGSGVLGGFLGGHGGNKAIDPTTLRNLFGPGAIAGDAQQLYQMLAASPQFAALMNSASNNGALAGQRLRGNMAQAGLGSSGVGALQNSVSRGFGTNLQLNARSDLFGQALQTALQNISQRMGIYGQSQLMRQQTPNTLQSFGNALTGGASMGLMAMGAQNGKQSAAMPSYGMGDLSLQMPNYQPMADTLVKPATMMRRIG